MEETVSVKFGVRVVHTCGMSEAGVITCWGANGYGQSDAPIGTFQAVDVGVHHNCAIRDNHVVVCWGDNRFGQSDAPTGRFVSVSAGAWHSCGLRDDSTITCWGDNTFGQSAPPEEPFVSVAAGGWHTCGLRPDRTITCWGARVQPDGFTLPEGEFLSIGPSGYSEAESALLDPVLPDMRRWVAATLPANVAMCLRMLRAVAAITLWSCHTLGSVDERFLWHPRNVEWWVMEGNAHRSRHWRHNTRWALRCVGRAVNPDGWPEVPRPAGRSTLPAPYSKCEGRAFMVAAGPGGPGQPCWPHVGGGSLLGGRAFGDRARYGCH